MELRVVDSLHSWNADTSAGTSDLVVSPAGLSLRSTFLGWSELAHDDAIAVKEDTLMVDGLDPILAVAGDSLSLVCRVLCVFRHKRHKTKRVLEKVLSLARWPAENIFFRKFFPLEFLENHFACASLPQVGRLYFSRQHVLVSLSMGWGSSESQFDLYGAQLHLDGMLVTLDSLTLRVALAGECYAGLRAAQEALQATKCFGVPLATLQERQGAVPTVVRRCIEVVEAHLDDEGLFRVSGSAKVVNQLVLCLDEGCPIAWDQVQVADAASLLKRFFSDLPDKLFSFFEALKVVVEADDDTFKGVLHQHCTSPLHLELLHFFFAFLSRVAAHADTNRMTPQNLAMVFAPVVVELPDMMDFGPANALVLRGVTHPELFVLE